MTKILVTGGAGYIGSHVVKQLQKKGFDVIVFDNFSTGNRGAVKNVAVVEGDLQNTKDIEKLFETHKFDAVMHFAGSIKVPESVENPIKYYKNNTLASLNLIDACQRNKVQHFIFSSTAAVYGIPEGGIAFENSKLNPINPYGRSKLMTENLLGDLHQSDNSFKFVILRYFNVSGADVELEIGQAFPEPFHLINIACEAATGKRAHVNIFGTDYETKDGTCIRDYIHVVDLADAHVKALEYLLAGGEPQRLNCGYGKGFSVKEVIEKSKEVTQVDFKLINSDRRDGDPPILIAAVDKIKDILGWTPKYNDLNFIIKTAFEWESGDKVKLWRKK